MAKEILLKRSSRPDNPPSQDKLKYGELAVNYNVSDVKIFTKDSDNNIVSIVDDSKFAKYFSTVHFDTPTENIVLNKASRLNVITLNSASLNGKDILVESGNIIGNEINAILINETSSDITLNVPSTINGLPVKSFSGDSFIVPSQDSDLNMVEYNILFDGQIYFVRFD